MPKGVKPWHGEVQIQAVGVSFKPFSPGIPRVFRGSYFTGLFFRGFLHFFLFPSFRVQKNPVYVVFLPIKILSFECFLSLLGDIPLKGRRPFLGKGPPFGPLNLGFIPRELNIGPGNIFWVEKNIERCP